MLEPWIPYKGNKAGIMDNIWASMRSVAMPDPKGFVCPFCGGGAFEYFLAQHGYKVLMSDLEKGVVELHKLCASKEGLETLRKWKEQAFTKEQFNEIKNEDTAFSAYVRSLWSFSNDGKTYLTSLENQDNKIQQYFDGCAEPNTRYKHIEDISILHLQKNIDVEQRCCSYQDVEIPEGFVCYCFDDKTEILTKRGWINVSDIRDNDEFLSREPNTAKLEYVKNTKRIEVDYDGYMYSYEGKNVSIMVSENHKLFVNKRVGKAKKRTDTTVVASDAYKTDFKFISAGGVWAGSPDMTINILGERYDKVKFARLLGIFLTDGSINNRGLITISQTKPKIREIIKTLLVDLGIQFAEHKNYFYIAKKYKGFFQQFYLKDNRKIPNEFKNGNKEVLLALLDGILDGDSDNERRRVYLGSKTLVDDIQEIAYKVGLSSCYSVRPPRKAFLKSQNRWITGTKPQYVVSINNNKYLSHLHKNENRVKHKGKLYCCCLEKWHTVLTRRNGKCIWINQCDPPYAGTWEYKAGGFDHQAFYDWCLKQDALVFISEYSMPDDFFLVDEYFKFNEGGGALKRKAAVERLYANKPVHKLSLF